MGEWISNNLFAFIVLCIAIVNPMGWFLLWLDKRRKKEEIDGSTRSVEWQGIKM